MSSRNEPSMVKAVKWALAAAVLSMGAGVLAGCHTTPVYGPETPRNGAGAPIDSQGIPLPGTAWRK